jgi:glycosyltransferase involved in cell wall biosynthesis
VTFDWIPWRLREGARSFLERGAAREMARVREGISRSEDLRLGFGGVLDDGRPVHGGAVKLLALRDGFAGEEREFSILYAVSSSPPRFAEPLFKLCRKRGIRIVWNQNGVAYPAWAGREGERFNGPMRRLRAMADFVVYQSRFCEESARRFLGECDKPSEILFNPVDTGRFSPVLEKRKEGPLRLLAAGTHGTRDRVINALEALALLRRRGSGAVMSVAGSFQWKNGEGDFQESVRRLGLEGVVARVARFSQADAADLYRSHDILVHPKYMDPCPTVVLEALACGLPVAGSASGGLPEMLDSTCAALVPAPEDWDRRHTPGAAELADAIEKVAGKLGEMAEAARRRAVERFSVQPWIEAHWRIFLNLLS